MKSIFKYMAKYWYLYLFTMICLVGGVLMDMTVPQVTRRIIDDVIIGGDHSILMGLLIALFLLATAGSMFRYFQEFTGDCTGVRIARDIRRKLFAHIEQMSVGFFDKNNTGELMSRLTNDVERVQDAAGFIGMLGVQATIHTIVTMVCMVRISPVLTLVPICILPMVAYVAIQLEKKLDKVYDEISEENGELNTVAQENLTGVRTVKAFSREQYEIEKFKKHNGRYYELNMNLARTLAKYDPNISFFTKLLLVLSVTLGGILVVGDQISLGQLGAFIEYANNIVWPMEILGWIANSLAAAVASNKKIDKILEERPQIFSPQEPERLGLIKGNVTFDGVGLKLADQTILEDISFHVPAGKTLGVMGMTGSGKTTLINLMERFYDVTEGSVRLDGVDVRQLDLHQLRDSFGVVMQDVFLFSDTVAENVRFGSKDWMTGEHVEKASRSADAHEFVSKLPKGYDTVIGEKGVGLSGGQKQRISIARALAKQAPILVLDDSTSALDMETEHQIQQELKDMKGVTKIIIAHRISAVRHADEIIILQDGKIAERGTHETLLKKKGLYYDTYVAQYEEPEENQPAETAAGRSREEEVTVWQ